ncbi:DUF2000 domain-containing protein [Streptomyces sp. NPDC026672]|uniref:DUF2000 domain-containing protein n=1 Tax=unclassified Streptomyces TaxID=2593676 RepID=UPI0033CA648D
MTHATAPAPEPVERLVIVVDQDLPLGHLANAVAVAGLVVGATMPHLLGAPLTDADGLAHTGTYTTGLPVLRADRDALRLIAARAVERGLGLCEFPAVAQTTNSYEELTSLVAGTPTEKLQPAAIAVHGTRKAVNSLTGSLPLLR